MRNDQNKKQFIQFLLSEWEKDEYAESLRNRQIYFAYDHMCVVLTSLDGESTDSRPVDCLYSSQEEADTLIILHSLNADAEENENMDIIVRISVCQKFKHPLYFDTGVSNKRRMIHIQTLCDKMAKDIPEIILSFHAFTGSDSTSVFCKKEKLDH